VKVKSVKKITDYSHLNMFEIIYSDTKNREKHWSLASRNDPPKCVSGHFETPDAVVIVAYHTEQKKLVIIKEFRVPLGDYQYGFPAGLVDAGETVESSVIRELKEETGLTVTQMNKVSPPVYSSSGMTDESVAMVYVECSGEVSKEGNCSSEDIETLFVSPDEARTLCGNSRIKFDVKTWLVLSQYGETGRVNW
jgi:ADP-ribose pyrophosphatase